MSVPGVRDLVEAEEHERRRLVSALVSGDPLPAQPPRPGRAVVAALALGAITLAVGLLLDALSGTDAAWPTSGLVVSRDSGSSYVVLEGGAVHPVTDGTSARLLLGSVTDPVVVDQRDVDDRGPGSLLGIAGAPAAVPSADRLDDGSWSACPTGAGATTVGIGAADGEVEPAPPDAGVLVRSSAGLALVTADDGGRARAYRLPAGPGADNLLLALGLPASDVAVEVSRRWLDLLPSGGDLSADTVALPEVGEALSYPGPGLPADARVGDWFPATGGARLLTASGPTVLTPFALAVWRGAAAPADQGPRELGVAAPPALPLAPAPYAAAAWPSDLRRPLDGRPCALLSEAGVRLGLTGREIDDQEIDDQEVDDRDGAGPGLAAVVPGRGALLRTPEHEEGHAVLVADDGRAYPVAGDDALEALGYGDLAPAEVPAAWLRLVERGPVLSVARALRTPAEGR